MKPRHVIVALVGALIVIGLYIHSSSSEINAGKPAPDFLLPSIDGSEINFHDFSGKVVLLNFWASWCPPCLMEMPSLRSLHDRFRDLEFTVVAVAVDEKWDPVRNFFKGSAVPFPVLLDSEGKIAEMYGSDRLPESFLIDRSGRVVQVFTGARDWDEAQTVEKIKRLLAHEIR